MSYRDCLQTFLTVYRLGSQSKAAEFLALTQPAVSQHLKILEQYLGRPLFSLVGRGLQPTALAHQLALDVTDPLDRLSEVLISMKQGDQQLQGDVYVGGLSSFFTKVIVPHLSALSEHDVRVRFTIAYEGLESALLNNELQLVQFCKHVTHPQITVEKLHQQQFVLIGHPKFKKLIKKKQLDDNNIQCLERLPWIAYDQTLLFITEYFHTVFQQEFAGNLKLVIADLWPILDAVRAGVGVTVLPSYFCQEYLDGNSVQILYQTENAPSHNFYIGWKQGALRDPKIRLVYELYKQACMQEI